MINEYHGKSYTRLYNIWQGMKQRCTNPNNRNYKQYGGRGIEVCTKWDESFKVFERWALRAGYADNLTIDRIDNNGNYEPKNCQWITRSENAKKRKEDNKKPRKTAPTPEVKTPEQIKLEKRREKMFRKIYGDDWKYYADMNSCQISYAEKRRIKRRHDLEMRKSITDDNTNSE